MYVLGLVLIMVGLCMLVSLFVGRVIELSASVTRHPSNPAPSIKPAGWFDADEPAGDGEPYLWDGVSRR